MSKPTYNPPTKKISCAQEAQELELSDDMMSLLEQKIEEDMNGIWERLHKHLVYLKWKQGLIDAAKDYVELVLADYKEANKPLSDDSFVVDDNEPISISSDSDNDYDVEDDIDEDIWQNK